MRWLVSILVLSLSWPETVEAAVEQAPPRVLPLEVDLRTEGIGLHTLIERGTAAYQSTDYAAAGRLWTLAVDLTAGEPSLRDLRESLLLPLARAELRAYVHDADPARLRRARAVLDELLLALANEPPTDLSRRLLRQEARQLRDDLEGFLPEPEAVTVTRTPSEVFMPASARVAAPSPRRAASDRAAIVLGGVLVGLGAACGGTAIATASWGREAQDRFYSLEDSDELKARYGRQALHASTATIGAGVSAVVLATAGIALLVTRIRSTKPRLGMRSAASSSRGRPAGMRWSFAF